MRGYNPAVFSIVLSKHCDVLGVVRLGSLLPPPTILRGIAYLTITQHNGVSDVILRGRNRLPPFEEMVFRPEIVVLMPKLPGAI